MNKFILILLILLSGCANPINQKTADNYYQAGQKSLYQGDLSHASEMYVRALVNARLGHMGDEAEAQILAKLGRTYGNMCKHTEAEEAFNKSISLYDNVYGVGSVRTFPTRLELAQFAYDIGWHDKPVSYFKGTLPIGQEQLKSVDPLGYSAVMKDYADALQRAGKEKESLAATKLALEQEGKVGSANITQSEYIRYPKECS